MEEDLFPRKIGRLQFYFKKNGSKVQIAKVCLDEDCNIENIREFPYEKELVEAKREAYRYFGINPSRKKRAKK